MKVELQDEVIYDPVTYYWSHNDMLLTACILVLVILVGLASYIHFANKRDR